MSGAIRIPPRRLRAVAPIVAALWLAPGGAALAAEASAERGAVAVREFSMSGLPSEVPSVLGMEVAEGLARGLAAEGFSTSVLPGEEPTPGGVRFLLVGQISAADPGSGAGRLMGFGGASLAGSVTVRDLGRGVVLLTAAAEKSAGGWSSTGTLHAAADELGAEFAAKLVGMLAKQPPAPRAPDADAVPTPRPTRAPAVASAPRRPLPTSPPRDAEVRALAGTWRNAEGDSLEFAAGEHLVERSGDVVTRTGTYEVIDAGQVALTLAPPDGTPDAPGTRKSSYVVRYKVSGDELTLIYLDSEVWKYKRQR